MLNKFIKVLQDLLNFSNCISLVVTLTNLLILLSTKQYSLDMVGCILSLLQIKSQLLLKKMSKNKNSDKYEDKNKNLLT